MKMTRKNSILFCSNFRLISLQSNMEPNEFNQFGIEFHLMYFYSIECFKSQLRNLN